MKNWTLYHSSSDSDESSDRYDSDRFIPIPGNNAKGYGHANNLSDREGTESDDPDDNEQTVLNEYDGRNLMNQGREDLEAADCLLQLNEED